MIDQKQLFQIQNILETLIEATDHFSNLIKNKELNQSIYIFTSIVEGSQAVTNILNSANKDYEKHTKKLEEFLVLIANELENGRFIKVSEIIQFSLRPLLVKLNKSFIEDHGDQKTKETISIGMFHSWRNPKDFLSEDRLQATLNEANNQNTELYFFTSKDIDFENEQISADTFQNNQWKRVTAPFPTVINNVGAGRRSRAERKLQRFIPFTGFHVGNKFTLPQRMLKHRKYAELLVPFTVCLNEDKVYHFMDKNNNVVFKALGSNRGENIYFVTKKGSRYIMLDQKKERILNEEEFKNFIKNTILSKKGSYIIQRYIHTRTKEDEPYHFRSHVQKDHNGKWQITHIYPRVGNKKSNLSNISTEGRVDDFPAFLRHEFGNKQGSYYEQKILDLSMKVTQHLDKLYGLALNELGLDFAIDDTGRIWMHEANNGPQTAYHEEKRAVNFIGYAKYIAENGVMHVGQANIAAIANGQFQARNTDLPIAEDKDSTSIGMLIGQQNNDKVSIQLALTAAAKNLAFYSFTPKDIDYDLGLIRGSFYKNDEWVQKVAEFPSVIIDRLKMRTSKEQIMIYDELEDIPFTNEWVADATSRLAIYELLQENDSTSDIVAPYQSVKRPLHVFQFLEKYGQVQLKQEDMSYRNLTYTIRTNEANKYEVLNGKTITLYTENQLRHYINYLIEEKKYIVHQYLSNSDSISEIHCHLMKDENDGWSVVSKHAELQDVELNGTVTYSRQSLSEFMEYHNDEKDIEDKINSLAISTALCLEDETSQKISELFLKFMITDKTLFLIETNPNGPYRLYDHKLYANALMKYAEVLANGKIK